MTPPSNIAGDIAGALAQELDAGAVVGPSAADFAVYGRDECDDVRLRRVPECVVLARHRADIEIALRVCAERGVPLTPRGAGSGKAGGCVPTRGGVVLSTERMNRIVELDEDDMLCVCQPGVVTGTIQDAADGVGLFYPPDPASLAFSSIGGNAATNAGGPRAFKYGVTREYVLGLETVLMGGEVLAVGRRAVKGVTGYDLTAGFVGSEGTLAVISELTLKLIPRPQAVRTALAIFADVHHAGTAVSALIKQGFRPRTLELLDRTCIDHCRGKTAYAFPASAGAAVLVELDGDEQGLDDALEQAGLVCEDHGATDVLVARDEANRRSLWQARRELSSYLRSDNRFKVSEDICVPRGALPEMLRRIDRIAAATDIAMATFGHAGDGNLHVQFLLDGDPADPALGSRVESGLERLMRETVELRGTLSGEHGIGAAKSRFVHLEQPERTIEWQRRIKALWDPGGLLNPGKLFPPPPGGCAE